MDYGDEDHLNDGLWLPSAVWQHRTKWVCAGFACCRVGWSAALSDDTAAEGGMRKCVKVNLTFYLYLF